MSSSEKIAGFAYQLWEAEGCPVGRELEHWRIAEAYCRLQDSGSPTYGIAAFAGLVSPHKPPESEYPGIGGILDFGW